MTAVSGAWERLRASFRVVATPTISKLSSLRIAANPEAETGCPSTIRTLKWRLARNDDPRVFSDWIFLYLIHAGQQGHVFGQEYEPPRSILDPVRPTLTGILDWGGPLLVLDAEQRVATKASGEKRRFALINAKSQFSAFDRWSAWSNSTSRFAALDGGRVEIGTSLRLGPESCNAGAELRDLGIKYQHLLSGPLGLARHYALSPQLSEGMQLTQEFAFQGGTLWLGSGVQLAGADGARYGELAPDGQLRPAPVHMAAWEGDAHSLLLFRYTGQSIDLLHILDHFVITDTPQGITAIPRDPASTFYVSGPKVTVDIPDFALLDVRQLTPQLARELPRASGTQVPGGELFVRNRNEESRHLVLVGPSTVTFIMSYGVPEDRLMAGVMDTRVSGSWEQ